MALGQAELVKAWRTVLDLCKVHAGEMVAVLTRPNIQIRNLDAAHHALEEIGCHVFQIEPKIIAKPLRENTVAMAALKTSNMVIDFVGLHLLRAMEQHEIQTAGSRILYVVEPPEALVRLRA